MKGYCDDIDRVTKSNKDFRHVLYTGKNLQLVVMSLRPQEDIGLEKHMTHDQFFRIEAGTGEVSIDGVTHAIKEGTAIVVPAGALHNVMNTGNTAMHLYTVYAPPNHVDQLVQATKAVATASSEQFDGKVTG